ncbi:hypothetical protein K461DRAFT_267374 [Myriangium duriaei CBS 260.36]|uniref:Stc1 domain-containing protein n=1 Tax=Myriangium duriaei CBS 260.36 TaxID=1168546 RepID=A0A9P4J4B4_9PEZI|nr:hypothetical protein K461DRAFT_267374 [Myriangium duriaei CBS 260.36]
MPVHNEKSVSDDSSVVLPRREFKPNVHLRSKAPILTREITCSICRVPKNERAFSRSQKDRYSADRQYAIECLECSGGIKKQEITCTGCDKTLPLDKFAKSQRKDKDIAPQECYDCVATRVDTPAKQAERAMKELAVSKPSKSKACGAYGGDGWHSQNERYDLGVQEWSDGGSDISVEDSESDDDHYSV